MPAGISGPRDPLDTKVDGPTLAERNPTHPPLFRPAIRAASAAWPLRYLAQNKTDGVGFEPTRRFHVCRFSRSAKPLRALPAGTPLNKAKTRLGSSGTGRQAIEARTRIEPNRDTTSQIETTHQTSQRQVALGLSRNGGAPREVSAGSLLTPSPDKAVAGRLD